MRKPEELLELSLERVRQTKQLKGQFIVNRQYEQGPLPVQRCTILSIYYKEGNKVKPLYRWRACSATNDIEQSNEEAYIETLASLILNWEEIWNSTNTKPQ
jgi:hypothetical protein